MKIIENHEKQWKTIKDDNARTMKNNWVIVSFDKD